MSNSNTEVLKGSILSIFRLERLLLHHADKKILRNDVRICLHKKQFTIQPGTSKQSQALSFVQSKKTKLPLFSCALFLLAIFLFLFIVRATFPYPLHASCLVKWNFGEPCTYISQRLKSQIIKWSNYKDCGMKCLYKLNEPYENDRIHAIHISPKYNVIDSIDIFLSDYSNRSCIVLAESSAKKWYTLFDDGRNYCNLRNLITGSGYDIRSHFLESTNNLICTQYDMVYCN